MGNGFTAPKIQLPESGPQTRQCMTLKCAVFTVIIRNTQKC